MNICLISGGVAGTLFIAEIAFYASYRLGTAHFWTSYALLVVSAGATYAPYGPFFAWITELMPRNVAGGAIALVNSCGALGTYCVGYRNGATGGNGASYLFMAASLLAATGLTLAVRRPSKARSIA